MIIMSMNGTIFLIIVNIYFLVGVSLLLLLFWLVWLLYMKGFDCTRLTKTAAIFVSFSSHHGRKGPNLQWKNLMASDNSGGTSSDSHNAHHSHNRRVDGNEVGFQFFEDNADDGQKDDGHIQLVPFVFHVASHPQRHHFAHAFDDEDRREKVVEYSQRFHQFLQSANRIQSVIHSFSDFVTFMLDLYYISFIHSYFYIQVLYHCILSFKRIKFHWNSRLNSQIWILEFHKNKSLIEF